MFKTYNEFLEISISEHTKRFNLYAIYMSKNRERFSEIWKSRQSYFKEQIKL